MALAGPPAFVFQSGEFPFQVFYAGEDVEVWSGQAPITLPLSKEPFEGHELGVHASYFCP